MTTKNGQNGARVFVKGDVASQIFQIITGKGWAFYFRGSANVRVLYEETLQMGPVDSLALEALYLILPRVNDPHSEEELKGFVAKHQVMPKMKVPNGGFDNYGRAIYHFEGKDEVTDCLKPGQGVSFIGIELRENEVRLHAPSETFMPYPVFQKAILSIPDITGLERF